MIIYITMCCNYPDEAFVDEFLAIQHVLYEADDYLESDREDSIEEIFKEVESCLLIKETP
jgi:hypothetical protein